MPLIKFQMQVPSSDGSLAGGLGWLSSMTSYKLHPGDSMSLWLIVWNDVIVTLCSDLNLGKPVCFSLNKLLLVRHFNPQRKLTDQSIPNNLWFMFLKRHFPVNMFQSQFVKKHVPFHRGVVVVEVAKLLVVSYMGIATATSKFGGGVW